MTTLSFIDLNPEDAAYVCGLMGCVTLVDEDNVKVCRRCEAMRYCSHQCMRKDRAEHMKFCYVGRSNTPNHLSSEEKELAASAVRKKKRADLRKKRVLVMHQRASGKTSIEFASAARLQTLFSGKPRVMIDQMARTTGVGESRQRTILVVSKRPTREVVVQFADVCEQEPEAGAEITP